MTVPKCPDLLPSATNVGPDGDAAACDSSLTLTGERTLPHIPDEAYWFARHLVAYERAAALVADSTARRGRTTVLDAGCGEGYGLGVLAAAGADRVVGADLDPAVVAHAASTYARNDPRIEVVTAELMRLPLADDEVDVTVSFQVIEHLHDIPGYLASLRRVTHTEGTMLIATPNRLTFTPGSSVPVNPFHTREFTAAELDAELTHAGLVVERMLGVHHAPRLAAFEAARGDTLQNLLSAGPPETWDDELRGLVHGTTSRDFEVAADDLDACLDLFARCRVPADRSGRAEGRR